MTMVGSALSLLIDMFEPAGGFKSISRPHRQPEFYGAFGRTMAQPTRNSGWRPFTIHSNARGTSGTRPGKRCAMSGGGGPEVSEERQTTTPPVWLNFATDCHGVRS